MNPKLSLIYSRRSVRRFESRPVPADMIRDLLAAGMAAPSACAKDPWHVVVVTERAMLRRLAEGLPNGTMLGDAAAGLVVCGDLETAYDRQISYLLQDCSAMIENVLIAAAALDLGACWLGVHPREDRIAHVRRVLNIPPAVVPVSAIAVGWPAERKEPRTRFQGGRVHEGTW